MPKPSLTIEPTGILKIGSQYIATLHDVPPHFDRTGVQLAQCASDDIRIEEDCVYDLGGFGPPAPGASPRWTGTVATCRDPDRDCYFAVTGGGKGFPEIARTTRIPTTP